MIVDADAAISGPAGATAGALVVRGMMPVWLRVIAILLTVIGWAPLIGIFLTYGIANLAGCQVDEGSVHPCLVGPVDIGGLLYSLGVSGWLFLATWPLAALSVVFWIGYAVSVVARSLRG